MDVRQLNRYQADAHAGGYARSQSLKLVTERDVVVRLMIWPSLSEHCSSLNDYLCRDLRRCDRGD
jgi:hypothetical protein